MAETCPGNDHFSRYIWYIIIIFPTAKTEKIAFLNTFSFNILICVFFNIVLVFVVCVVFITIWLLLYTMLFMQHIVAYPRKMRIILKFANPAVLVYRLYHVSGCRRHVNIIHYFMSIKCANMDTFAPGVYLHFRPYARRTRSIHVFPFTLINFSPLFIITSLLSFFSPYSTKTETIFIITFYPQK